MPRSGVMCDFARACYIVESEYFSKMPPAGQVSDVANVSYVWHVRRFCGCTEHIGHTDSKECEANPLDNTCRQHGRPVVLEFSVYGLEICRSEDITAGIALLKRACEFPAKSKGVVSGAKSPAPVGILGLTLQPCRMRQLVRYLFYVAKLAKIFKINKSDTPKVPVLCGKPEFLAKLKRDSPRAPVSSGARGPLPLVYDAQGHASYRF